MTQQAHIWIRGKVQGVGFRAFVQYHSLRLGCNGWVRNVGEDAVEALLQGESPALEALLNILRTGPRASRVDELTLEWQEIDEEFVTLEIRHSQP